jgi:hypothetical protein
MSPQSGQGDLLPLPKATGKRKKVVGVERISSSSTYTTYAITAPKTLFIETQGNYDE